MLLIASGGIALFILVTLWLGISIVPQKQEFIVERLGKYHRTLTAGLNIIIPVVDRIAYKQSLKEFAIEVPPQEVITKDNITVSVGGNLYVSITDSVSASYNVANWRYAVEQLAQSVMRAEVGKLQLDDTFSNRSELNSAIVHAVSERSSGWGVFLRSYELAAVEPPASIKESMERTMKAERLKRASILEAEGKKASEILEAEGKKEAVVLEAQAKKEAKVLAAQGQKEEEILHAQGQAAAIEAIAAADANSLKMVGAQLETENGKNARDYDLAKRAIDAKQALAKESTVMLLTDKQTDPAETVATAMAVSTALATK
ncbi:SPFH domain-containing protein [Vibrio coralliirubri]|uniref:SPFH domain-containing protein n=1 Tax=Vibrio coralliirubri TaxID=1516159 RepID=UPI002283B9D6|nr:SPFH domain-containing protein [Vibrio coralliirubri]MCY9861192.1 SPFH domain-containing protein [Vibrio coralliirubri]